MTGRRATLLASPRPSALLSAQQTIMWWPGYLGLVQTRTGPRGAVAFTSTSDGPTFFPSLPEFANSTYCIPGAACRPERPLIPTEMHAWPTATPSWRHYRLHRCNGRLKCLFEDKIMPCFDITPCFDAEDDVRGYKFRHGLNCTLVWRDTRYLMTTATCSHTRCRAFSGHRPTSASLKNWLIGLLRT